MEDLGPIPFRRIDAADIACVVGEFPGAAEGVDLLGLGDRRVVLPQDAHGVGIFCELVVQGQGGAVGRHRDRRGAGGVDTDADDPTGKVGPPLEGAADGGGHRFQIVGRVVTELLAGGVAVLLLAPLRIVCDGLGNFVAVGHAHHHGTDGIRSEIQSDYEVLIP